MNYFNLIKNMNIDELAEFLEQYAHEVASSTRAQLALNNSTSIGPKDTFKQFLLSDVRSNKWHQKN